MKTTLITILAVLFSLQLFAISPENGYLTINESSYTRLKFTAKVSKEDLTFVKVNTPMGLFTQIGLKEANHSLQPGDPRLPVIKELIEAPVGAGFSVHVLSATYQEYRLGELGNPYPLMPAQPSLSKSDNPANVPFRYNAQTYQTDAFYGFDAVSVENLGFMRGVRIARLEIAPVTYNPVTGIIRVMTHLEAEVVFEGADVAATMQLKKDKYSMFFEPSYHSLINYKELSPSTKDVMTKYPVKYVIVSDPMFQTTLQPFVQWKTKKGFKVIEAYTNDPLVGNTTTSIKNYLQGLYNAGTAGDPAPTYVLFVGDVAQVPSNPCSGHVSDLYYCEYTGDYIPEMIYGRFSATNVSQLQPQIDKTLEYEQYLMPDKSFLNEVVMIAGVDAGAAPTYGNGQINYGTDNYFNASNNLTSHTYLYPASETSDAQIIQNVSDGVCFANYTAHGGSDGWSDPTFNVTNVATLTNAHKYPLMVGNCCLTNKFDDTECFGEALLRANLKGALGYIGGSNVSYWDEDYYFGVGYRSSIAVNPTYSATALGAYDRVFHSHGETFSKWTMSQGQYLYGGNLAVTQGGSMVQYYWEIYHLMGDPSLMVYFSVPPAITAVYNPLIPLGSTSFQIQTDPWAYAAVSMNGTLLGAALADSLGNVIVPLTGATVPGTADVVVTAQNRAPHIATVVIANPAGPYVLYAGNVVQDATGNSNGLVDYSEAINLDITLHNFGQASANGINATLSGASSYLTLTDNTQSFGDIASASDATQTGAYSFTVANNIPDQEVLPFTLNITDNASNAWSSNFSLTANAPQLEIGQMSLDDASGNNNGCLDAGETLNVIINTLNNGHADANGATGTLTTTTPQYVTINNGTFNFGNLVKSTNADASFSMTVASSVPDSALVELIYTVVAGGYSVNYHYLIPLGEVDEDFETGDFSKFDWQSAGTTPWTITNVAPYEGLYCAKSGVISDNQSTVLKVTMKVMTADTISFWKKVSSESGYDNLTFNLDGSQMGEWSGEIAWSKSYYMVTAGEHTFSWEYAKDVSIASGSDCAWLDYIVFPPVISGYTNTGEMESLIASLNCTPNPASGMTLIQYTLNESSAVTLRLLDITGREVKVLHQASAKSPGTYNIMLNVAPFESGLYYLVLNTGSESKTARIIITK